ncbi:MAG: type II toxin-antitoxin system VapC family toxin [Spirochaetia bacterium]
MLLDTCALLWLAAGEDRLSQTVVEKIEASISVAVSAISAFEVAIKTVKDKLTLPLPAPEWWSRVIEHHHLSVLQVTDEIFLKAALLPQMHSDPADRIIIATALIHDLTIVTADTVFERYGVKVEN